MINGQQAPAAAQQEPFSLLYVAMKLRSHSLGDAIASQVAWADAPEGERTAWMMAAKVSVQGLSLSEAVKVAFDTLTKARVALMVNGTMQSVEDMLVEAQNQMNAILRKGVERQSGG